MMTTNVRWEWTNHEDGTTRVSLRTAAGTEMARVVSVPGPSAWSPVCACRHGASHTQDVKSIVEGMAIVEEWVSQWEELTLEQPINWKGESP